MFDKLMDAFDDFDPSRVKDVVEAVWEDKDKIGEVVSLVWENREAITTVIEFVQGHKDQIMEVVSRLPEMLATTGSGIAAAGASAVQASGLLTGSDDDDMSARRLAEIAADALDTCRAELVKAAGLVGRVGDQVDALKIPSVSPKYTEIMGFNVVTGVDIGEMSLLDDAVGELREGAGTIEGISGSLAEVSKHLRVLGSRLTDAGADLDKVGAQLQESGGLMQQVATIGKK